VRAQGIGTYGTHRRNGRHRRIDISNITNPRCSVASSTRLPGHAEWSPALSPTGYAVLRPGIEPTLCCRAESVSARADVWLRVNDVHEPHGHAMDALFYISHSRSNGSHQANGPMARNKWESGLHRPITVGCVEIRVTYSAGLGFHQVFGLYQERAPTPAN
jgi:hypothetical protein